MKRMFAVISMTLFFGAIYASSTNGGIEEIKLALKNGDAVALSKYFHTTIEVEIDGDVQYYKKNDATEKLTSFFETHSVKGFDQAHQGSTKDGQAQFMICHLDTNKGKYRVFVLVKSKGDQSYIQEMNFTKE